MIYRDMEFWVLPIPSRHVQYQKADKIICKLQLAAKTTTQHESQAQASHMVYAVLEITVGHWSFSDQFDH